MWALDYKPTCLNETRIIRRAALGCEIHKTIIDVPVPGISPRDRGRQTGKRPLEDADFCRS